MPSSSTPRTDEAAGLAYIKRDAGNLLGAAAAGHSITAMYDGAKNSGDTGPGSSGGTGPSSSGGTGPSSSGDTRPSSSGGSGGAHQEEHGQVFLIQCMSHILHNALLTACKVAFGPDPTKVFFFLAQLAAFGADFRPHLRAYGIKYICPVPTDSRWDSYTYTAKVLRMARDLGKSKNAELVDKLFDGEYIIMCTIVVVWNRVIGTPEFLYIESGGAFHMSHIHARIRRTKAIGYAKQ
ncbi:hypothetical protein HYH02_012548 [Chlamydomonas schloesseri]|uniref:Uncharacterized protein n=1 Tax=Chlamydomonas schloesseri TaxID=2026947 RepID=A0A835W1L2_9CHLO|nr:hypothetical protein HYH02_012548 [Chlamydomonas schloesseri]|eukprot:KAG2433619.1 hypothetical protein HYH02_012548 [Chlamydomonas schloesseri]